MKQRYWMNWLYKMIISLLLPIMAVATLAAENPVADGFSLKDDEQKKENVDVVVGMPKVYTLDFVPSEIVHINESMCDYSIAKERREIIFTPKRSGQTTAIIRDTYGNIKVELNLNITSTNQSEEVAELREYLGDIEGLEIGIKGKNVYVGGLIVVPDDLGRITTILEKHPDVIQLFELSPQTQEVIASKMQEEMKKFGLKDVTVRVVNKTFLLEGFVQKDTDKVLANSIAETLVPDRVQTLAEGSNRIMTISPRPLYRNFISIKPPKQEDKPPPKMIKIVAQFVELSKNYNKVFGFKWTPTLAAGGGQIQFGKTVSNGVTTKSDGTFSGTIANLLPKLSSAKSAGYARVIQSALILVKDSGQASISKKSVIPFLLGTGEFQRQLTVTPEFSLKVSPRILSKEVMELAVGLSVNMAQGQDSTGNMIQTNLIVSSLETAVVGGIAVNEGHTNYDKDPPSGKDEVDSATGSALFSFLKTKNYTINKGQFVVFLTPEIVDSASKATNEIKDKFRLRRR